MNYTPEEVNLLRAGKQATLSGQATYASNAQIVNLVANGHVEINPALTDGQGNVAFRATLAGTNFVDSIPTQPNAVLTPQSPAPASFNLPSNGFAIGSGFVVPVAKSAKREVAQRGYDFEKLALNDYIFVPATEKRPDPKKALASTISSANKRYAETTPRRYFRTFRAKAGVEMYGVVPPADGAYIVRVEPPANELAAPAV